MFLLELIEPSIEGNMRLKREVVQKSLDSVSVKPNTVTVQLLCRINRGLNTEVLKV